MRSMDNPLPNDQKKAICAVWQNQQWLWKQMMWLHARMTTLMGQQQEMQRGLERIVEHLKEGSKRAEADRKHWHDYTSQKQKWNNDGWHDYSGWHDDYSSQKRKWKDDDGGGASSSKQKRRISPPRYNWTYDFYPGWVDYPRELS